VADYYVHTTGSDSASGADDAPFLTLQHAYDSAADDDRIIFYAGTYAMVNSSPGNINISVHNYGDGLVKIDGSAGSGSTYGVPLRLHNDSLIDGSTGSNLQNIEIIGGTYACIAGDSTSSRSYHIKNVIFTGIGDITNDDDDANTTKYGCDRSNNSTIRNNVFRNIAEKAIVSITSNPGPIYVYNNLIYNCGKPSNNVGIVQNTHFSSEYIFNTIVGCTGSHGIDCNNVNGTVTNNLLAQNYFRDAAVHTRTNINNNNVWTELTQPTNGAYVDAASGSISATNLEINPELNGVNPWDTRLGVGISGDFSLKPIKLHYGQFLSDSPRNAAGSPLIGVGTNIVHITTDFSGSARPDTPTIGALEGFTTLKFNISPTNVSADKVLKDFTINHFNRISYETPRNVDQIPFGRAVIGPSNLKDRTTPYKLEKGK
tara:strand:- start:6794 stop:8080 length:1287 start_codon:yes stop_codon:yes gene_type:complete